MHPTNSQRLSSLKSLKLTVASLAAVAVVSLLTCNVFAGEGHKHKKCDAGTQECLDKMAAKLKTKGWLGIETAKIDDGWYKISAVVANSPAEQAGLQVGDVLISLNGVKVNAENKAGLKKVKKSLTPGSTANYVVKRQGTKQQVAVTLGQIPETQIAEWIGQHLLDHHATERVAAIN